MSLRPGDRLPRLRRRGRARDGSGAFYPLADRLAAFADEETAVLPSRVWADLVRFCPDVADDVTMLVLTPSPPSAP